MKTIQHENAKLMDLMEHQLKSKGLQVTRVNENELRSEASDEAINNACTDDEFLAAIQLASMGFDVRPR